MTLAAPRPRKKKFVIGPEHDGRHMSLEDFDQWPTKDGYRYELGRGVIQVSNIPLISHGMQVQEIRNQLVAYQMQNPDVIAYMGGGEEAKLLVGTLESERHPDWTVYKTQPSENTNRLWRIWIPEIVIEVVSEGSAQRNYEEKPQEYLDFGVREYWIVDGQRRRLTVMQRDAGRWREKVVKPGKTHTTTLLPKFAFDVKKVIGPGR